MSSNRLSPVPASVPREDPTRFSTSAEYRWAVATGILSTQRSNEFVDYYALLEVPPTARQEEIEYAYLRKASVCDPTSARAPNDALGHSMAEAQYSRLSNAYTILSDKVERATFDEQREMYVQLGEGTLRPPVSELGPRGLAEDLGVSPMSHVFDLPRAKPAQPPPKGKWNALPTSDACWTTWSKARTGCLEVVKAARALDLTLQKVEVAARARTTAGPGRGRTRIPQFAVTGEADQRLVAAHASGRQFWLALGLLRNCVTQAGELYSVERRLYETARDREPFRVQLRLRQSWDRLHVLEGKLMDSDTFLKSLLWQLEDDRFKGEMLFLDESVMDVLCQKLADAVMLWRGFGLASAPDSVVDDAEIEGVFGGRYKRDDQEVDLSAEEARDQAAAAMQGQYARVQRRSVRKTGQSAKKNSRIGHRKMAVSKEVPKRVQPKRKAQKKKT